MNDYEKISWIRLARTPGVGPIMFWELIGLFKTAEKALRGIRDANRIKNLAIPDVKTVERELQSAHKLGANIITPYDEAYPKMLCNLRDRPPLLTVLGDVSLLNQKAIAIVGSRNASLHGAKIAHDFAYEIGIEGFVIASGLARGIDLAAHKGAFNSGTIAVVAGGVDYIYPKENAEWYRRIGYEGGIIISELPVGCPPLTKHFPQRNRIIAGLAMIVVVIEAAQKSGTLITARQALDYGREVMAVPGSPADPRSHGANKLIQDGAAIAITADDIIKVANNCKVTIEDMPLSDSRSKDEKDDEQLNSNLISQSTEEDMVRYRKLVLSYLSCIPTGVAELVEYLHIPLSITMFVLIELELNGEITRVSNNKFVRIGI